MDLVQQLLQPVLQTKNANILGKLQRLRLVADVPLLLKVDFFLLPVLITPVVGVSGSQIAQNTGKNNHQQENRVYPGQNGQVYQKASDVFQQHGQGLPDMLGSLVVSLAALVSLGAQLCKGFPEGIGIGGFIALGCHLPDDGGADIHPGKQGIFLDVCHGPPDQE